MTTVSFPPSDDLQDRLEVTVDQDAASGDVLPVLAKLLINLASKRIKPPIEDGSIHVFSTPISQGADNALYPPETNFQAAEPF